MRKEKTISVVVPTYNEERYLVSFLDSICSQELKPCEVVIVDGNSTDKTCEIIGGYFDKFKEKKVNVKLVVEPRRGIVRARDLGFRKAIGEVIASCDADTVYQPDYLKVALSRVKKEYVAVTGRGLFENPPWFVKIEKALSHVRDSLAFKIYNTCFYPRAFNIVFLKKVYVDSPGMDINAVAAEDEVGLARLLNRKGRIYYEPGLVAVSSSRRNRRGGLFYYILRTIFADYWWGYIRSKYFKQKVEYERID